MNVLSLFAGIGGLELGLERAGMTTVGQVEIDPFCRQVLARHWPGVPRHDDVRTAVEWWQSEPRPHVDVVCGGFPCQDISSANTSGKRVGISGPKSGLWNSYRDVVASVRPAWVVIENSPNWRAWTPVVRQQLDTIGYRSLALELSAGSFGAPHRRPRAFVVAHADRNSESLLTFHEEVARIRPIPRRRGHWTTRGITVGMDDGLPSRVDRLRSLGNAAVPQVAEFIGRQVMAVAA